MQSSCPFLRPRDVLILFSSFQLFLLAQRQKRQEVGLQIPLHKQIRCRHREDQDALARRRQPRNRLHRPALASFYPRVQFCFISCGDAQFAPSPDALLGDLYRVSRTASSMRVSWLVCPVVLFEVLFAMALVAKRASHSAHLTDSIRALFQTAKRPAIMVVSYCNKINYG